MKKLVGSVDLLVTFGTEFDAGSEIIIQNMVGSKEEEIDFTLWYKELKKKGVKKGASFNLQMKSMY